MTAAVEVVIIENRMTSDVLQQSADLSIQALDTRQDVQSHLWFRIPSGNGYYVYKNAATGCLLDDLNGWSVAYGKLVDSAGALIHPNFQWRESRYDNGFIAFENRKSGRFLDNFECNTIRVNGSNGNHPN